MRVLTDDRVAVAVLLDLLGGQLANLGVQSLVILNGAVGANLRRHTVDRHVQKEVLLQRILSISVDLAGVDLVTAQEHIRKRAADDVAVRVYERVGKDRVGRGGGAAHQCDVVVEIVQAGLLHTGSGDSLAVVEAKSVDGVQNLLRGLGQAELPSLL